MTTAAQTKTTKGEETRAKILETALELFRERGYDETTMREVAKRAGVSLGNAYYYFTSKEHLIQAFYLRTHEEHVAACAPILAHRGPLKERLLGVMEAKLDTIEPYHRFSGILFKTAADPQSPLHPFSAESAPVREQSTQLFADVVNGAASTKVPDDLRAELPRLLWLYHMGIVLFWIHDTSPQRRKSRRLTELSVDLIARLIALASNPLLRPLRKAALRLVEETR